MRSAGARQIIDASSTVFEQVRDAQFGCRGYGLRGHKPKIICVSCADGGGS